MTFDPFGDFESRGYLRNSLGEKNMDVVKRSEHVEFRANVAKAIDDLAGKKQLAYSDILQTHKTLFSQLYPWAGQDRSVNAPGLDISKGGVSGMFAYPHQVERAAGFALRQGNDPEFMRAKPGEVMGNLAHAHAFLDGNGRTLMVVHGDLAHKAGISIDWKSTDKASYLTALTHELQRPGEGHLDKYLKPFVQSAVDRHEQLATLLGLKGLGPGSQKAAIPSAGESTAQDPAKQKL